MRTLKMIWFCLFVFVTFYYYGAGMVDGFMNYPLYYIAGKSNMWPQYKQMANQLSFTIAAPAMLLPFISLLFIWLRPSMVPRIAVIICVLLTFTSEILTVKIMWPIHGQLAVAYSDALVDKLLAFDRYVRKSLQTVDIIVVFYMLWCVLKKADAAERAKL